MLWIASTLTVSGKLCHRFFPFICTFSASPSLAGSLPPAFKSARVSLLLKMTSPDSPLYSLPSLASLHSHTSWKGYFNISTPSPLICILTHCSLTSSANLLGSSSQIKATAGFPIGTSFLFFSSLASLQPLTLSVALTLKWFSLSALRLLSSAVTFNSQVVFFCSSPLKGSYLMTCTHLLNTYFVPAPLAYVIINTLWGINYEYPC